MADRMFPGKYQSDFAVQVTSQISDAQQFTINFSNNNLLGSGNFISAYKTSKARVCVTVGMMTTGYDCTDILNICLFRPIFSPTDFIQIKGRGTRTHDFLEQLFDDSLRDGVRNPSKITFKLFDFFANCEYFEEEFNYDEVLKLPPPKRKGSEFTGDTGPVVVGGTYEHLGADILSMIKEEKIDITLPARAAILLAACAAWSVSSHPHDEFRQKFSIIQALFAEVYSRKARWWPSGDGMA
jgi:type I restriction enzyme, R subunit